MPVHFRQATKKLSSQDAETPNQNINQNSAPTSQSAPKILTDASDASAVPATAPSTRYMNHYLGVLATLRRQLKEKIGEGNTPPKEDIFQICNLLLKSEDEDFLIGLALQVFCTELDVGAYGPISKQLVEDLQGDEEWIEIDSEPSD